MVKYQSILENGCSCNCFIKTHINCLCHNFYLKVGSYHAICCTQLLSTSQSGVLLLWFQHVTKDKVYETNHIIIRAEMSLSTAVSSISNSEYSNVSQASFTVQKNYVLYCLRSLVTKRRLDGGNDLIKTNEFLLIFFLNRHHKLGLKISFVLKMKSVYLIEWSNINRYWKTGALAIASSRQFYKLSSSEFLSEGRFTSCNLLHTTPFSFPVWCITSLVLACH